MSDFPKDKFDYFNVHYILEYDNVVYYIEYRFKNFIEKTELLFGFNYIVMRRKFRNLKYVERYQSVIIYRIYFEKIKIFPKTQYYFKRKIARFNYQTKRRFVVVRSTRW